MNQELPDFDTLMDMAENRPEELEKLRREFTENLLKSAPERSRRRLRGLQFKVDMELRRAKNPTDRCIRVSQLMHESFSRLNIALNGAKNFTPANYQNDASFSEPVSAQIIPLSTAE